MIYIDTNVIIAFIDERDPNHGKAVELLESLEGDRVVSKLSLVELASVYSRAGLDESLALSIYSIKRIGARIVDVDFNEVLLHAFKLAPFLKLRTLDLLHVAACKVIGAKLFVTFDKDIISKSSLIDRIGIKIITR